MPIRKIVSDCIEKYHLIKYANHLLLFDNILKNRKQNALFLKKHPTFVPPPADLAYDAYHYVNWQMYHDLGLCHSKLIKDLIREYIFEKEIKICEWGCGPGRVIRHLHQIDGFSKVELTGTDYNQKSISWCKKNLPAARFLKNNLEPPLPIASEQFDCIYAISIFTHLSESMHFAWIKELFRVLKPNGILVFTTHGDNCSKTLPITEKEKYASGHLVIKNEDKEGKKNFSTYHPPRFIREKLLKNYKILKHMSEPAQYQLIQEVWCVKKA